MPEAKQVIRDGDCDQHEQHQQEFALLDEIGLAGLEDDLGDIEHRLVGRQLFDLVAQIQADAQRAADDQRPIEQQVPGRDLGPKDIERSGVQIGNRQIGLAGMRLTCRADQYDQPTKKGRQSLPHGPL